MRDQLADLLWRDGWLLDLDAELQERRSGCFEVLQADKRNSRNTLLNDETWLFRARALTEKVF